MSAEKAVLLAAAIQDVEEQRPRDPVPSAKVSVAEAIFLFLSLLIALVQAGILYCFHYLDSSPAYLDGFSPYTVYLARGLPSAITSNLPTAILFYLASSHLASEHRVRFAQSLTLFCYLLGSTWGALLLGHEVVAGES
jgi:hypothetical protein